MPEVRRYLRVARQRGALGERPPRALTLGQCRGILGAG